MIVTISEEAMTATARKAIANSLLDIGAVKFNISDPFTWTSGIRSPIYCDNRIITSIVPVRDRVISEFTNVISNKFRPFADVDIICGIATGGISYGVLIADRMRLPFIYVRTERKAHGLMKMIEGRFHKKDRVILIEDHISTGLSSMNAIEALRDEGIEIVSLFSIMTYGLEKTENRYKDAGIKHDSLCNLETVLEVAQERNILSSDDVITIRDFAKSPETWRQ